MSIEEKNIKKKHLNKKVVNLRIDTGVARNIRWKLCETHLSMAIRQNVIY